MSSRKGSTKMASKPPTAAAIESRSWKLTAVMDEQRGELHGMYLDRLQRGIITPAMIERESKEVQAILNECLTIRDHETYKLAPLHQRLAAEITDNLWKQGQINIDRVRVLNLLSEMLGLWGFRHIQDWKRPSASSAPTRSL